MERARLFVELVKLVGHTCLGFTFPDRCEVCFDVIAAPAFFIPLLLTAASLNSTSIDSYFN